MKGSGPKDAAPLTKRKGGRPRKNNDGSSPGSVARRPITMPQSSRDYSVTSRGEVSRTLRNGREQPVKPWFSGPYECVYIYGVKGVTNKYGRKKVYIHKLVKDHFSKEKKTATKPFIHHKDGDERNNAIHNLTYTSLEENLKARKFFYKDDKGKVARKKRGQKQ